MTILPDRAPTLFLLHNGIVKLLDNQLKPIERYFIKGGVADVARNRCAISSEKVFSVDSADLKRAKEKRDQALHEEDRIFYEFVVKTLEQNKNL